MKDRVYRILVNRVQGIKERYLKKKSEGSGRFSALCYLLWLNIQYYFLMRKRIGQSLAYPYYEEKRLFAKGSESSLSVRRSPERFAVELMRYEIISFDVFDTLIFRPFSEPSDLFLLIGTELGYPDFMRLRIEAEQKARKKKQREGAGTEVTLEEIWNILSAETGIPKEMGMRSEREWEMKCCYANPYMLCVVKELQRWEKRMIVVSDMYLGKDAVRELLKSCGYPEFEEYFVSCDYGSSKHDGGLYEQVKRVFGNSCTYVHVGDHPHADFEQAEKYGMKAVLYSNVNKGKEKYRAGDMSFLTGSIYRGIVNGQIHNGSRLYSREYEYGFIYGGLFAVGYCRFIHEYTQKHNIDRILFLARDGSVLLKVYRRMYPEESHMLRYAYWSRMAALKLTAGYYKSEYLERFVDHKVNQEFTMAQIMESMELSHLLAGLCEKLNVRADEELTYRNAENVRTYLLDSWKQVTAAYEGQQRAAGQYYERMLAGCRRAACVDIGWLGSGALMLDCAVNRIWGLDTQIVGILAGTNTSHSIGIHAGEGFLLNGRLVSYLYSQEMNRDIWKFHDPARNHNLYWELLLGAPEGSLKGFYPDMDGGVHLELREFHGHAGRVREIHRGILDFTGLFLETERRLGLVISVSGRDAYAPMLLACSRKNRKFMEALEGLLDEIHI